VAERLDLVQKIWDSIAASLEALPLTEAQRAELDRRLQAHAQNPEDVETWDEVKANIRQRK
jgi:putative addiction module component (TIGR02574 family)